MSLAERNMIHELAEQLQLSNILLREGLMLAIDHKRELVAVFRNTFETNEKKLERANRMFDNDGKNRY